MNYYELIHNRITYLKDNKKFKYIFNDVLKLNDTMDVKKVDERLHSLNKEFAIVLNDHYSRNFKDREILFLELKGKEYIGLLLEKYNKIILMSLDNDNTLNFEMYTFQNNHYSILTATISLFKVNFNS